MRLLSYFLLLVFLLFSCEDDKVLIFHTTNGGLILPDGFKALVVHDGVGKSRHLAVNDNGDIYVKLRVDFGKNGNVALRDNDGDGKADLSLIHI